MFARNGRVVMCAVLLVAFAAILLPPSAVAGDFGRGFGQGIGFGLGFGVGSRVLGLGGGFNRGNVIVVDRSPPIIVDRRRVDFDDFDDVSFRNVALARSSLRRAELRQLERDLLVQERAIALRRGAGRFRGCR